MELVGGAAEQTRQALTNMMHILEEANCSFENVVKTTVLLQDINQFAAVNAVYAEFFTDNQPARAAFQVSNSEILIFKKNKAIVIIQL